MRSIRYALVVPDFDWKNAIAHRNEMKRLGGEIQTHIDKKYQGYPIIFSNRTAVYEAGSFLRSHSIRTKIVNADDLVVETAPSAVLARELISENKSEHKSITPIAIATNCLDQCSLTGEELINDPTVMFSTLEAKESNYSNTDHILQEKNKLLISTIIYTEEIKKFQKKLEAWEC